VSHEDIVELVARDTDIDPTLDYTCACSGCWACSGHVKGCTCDVDWEEIREFN